MRGGGWVVLISLVNNIVIRCAQVRAVGRAFITSLLLSRCIVIIIIIIIIINMH